MATLTHFHNDHHRRTLLAPTSGNLPHSSAIVVAWITLKEARGQTVDLDRIGEPHHLIKQPQSAFQDEFDIRCERVRNHVRELRKTRMSHRPNGGDAA